MTKDKFRFPVHDFHCSFLTWMPSLPCYILPKFKTNHHQPIEPEDIRDGLQFRPSVGLCVISLPLFFLGLLLWGWQWKYMVELGVQVIRKVEHRILQLFGQNKKGLCLRLLQKIQRPGLHFRFLVLEGDTWKAEGRQLVMVRVGLSQGHTGHGH